MNKEDIEEVRIGLKPIDSNELHVEEPDEFFQDLAKVELEMKMKELIETIKLRKTIRETMRKTEQPKMTHDQIFEKRLTGHLKSEYMKEKEKKNLGIKSRILQCDECGTNDNTIVIIEAKTKTLRWGLCNFKFYLI